MAHDFELIPHTADLQIRVYGATMQKLFEHALIGMFNAMRPINKHCSYTNDRLVCPTLPITRDFGVNSPDQTALLVDFLSYALYLSDVHNEAYLAATFQICDSTAAIGTFKGIAVEGFEESEIKAVTYHDLKLIQKDGMWQTDIVFDI